MLENFPEIEIRNFVPVNLRSDPQDAFFLSNSLIKRPLADLNYDLISGFTKHWSFGYGKDPISMVGFEQYSGTAIRCARCATMCLLVPSLYYFLIMLKNLFLNFTYLILLSLGDHI